MKPMLKLFWVGIFLLQFLLITTQIQAKTKKITLRENEIELAFNYTKIKKLSFSDEKDIVIKYSGKDDIHFEYGDDFLSVSSSKEAKIDCYLPRNKEYIITMKDSSRCHFDDKIVTIYSQDGKIIEFDGKGMKILDETGQVEVEINENGIFVESDGEKVEISSRGIMVEDDDDSQNLTGFWGRLLGRMIKSIAGSAIRLVGKSPEKIVKHLINEEEIDFSDHSFYINSSENDLYGSLIFNAC